MKIRKLSMLGVFIALAMVLSYIESLLPIYLGVPGAKLGLPNVVIVLVMYSYGAGEALVINGLRITLTGFLFGSMFGILYAIAGAGLSFGGMLLLKKVRGVTIVAVSVVGGVLHNLGQLAIAFWVLKTPGLVYYAPMLMIAGVGAGLLIGIVNRYMLPYMPKLLAQK